MSRIRTILGMALICAAAAAAAGAAQAADRLKVAVSHKSTWDAIFTLIATDKGFFREQNLDVQLTFAAGGSDTVQTVTTGAVDMASPAAILSTIAAYAKGVPIRIVASQMLGSPDIYWYVRSDSPIRKIADLNGKNLAYSRPGSVTHIAVLNLVSQEKISPKLTSAGGLPATMTMLMTGQVDVGWGAVPFGLEKVRSGEIRVLFTGDDIKSIANVASRVVITSERFLKERRDLVRRFLVAHHKAVHWVYNEHPDEAAKRFAEDNQMDLAVAKDSMKFFTAARHDPAPVRGLEASVAQAVEFKMIEKPLTKEQLAGLVDIVYDPGKK
jgi:NitT/TauT family transport system substrate-binding protein